MYLEFTDPLPVSIGVKLIAMSLIIFTYAFVFYVNSYLLFPKLWNKKILFSCFSLVAFSIYVYVDYYNFYIFIPTDGEQNPFSASDLKALLIGEAIQYLIITGVAFGSFLNRKLKKELEEQLKKEKQILIGDLSFFKNQFNDHVVFNFLNYCYAHANKTSPETASIIAQYADMTRYTLHVKSNEETDLHNEITYLENFISLKQKLSEGGCIDFKIIGDVSSKKILPRMLITLVENAFKHGESHDPNSPITILLHSREQEIEFTVSNKKKKSGPKPISTSVGRINMQNQLEKFYPNRYKMETQDLADSYAISLKLF